LVADELPVGDLTVADADAHVHSGHGPTIGEAFPAALGADVDVGWFEAVGPYPRQHLLLELGRPVRYLPTGDPQKAGADPVGHDYASAASSAVSSLGSSAAASPATPSS